MKNLNIAIMMTILSIAILNAPAQANANSGITIEDLVHAALPLDSATIDDPPLDIEEIPQNLADADDHTCMAIAIYHEARGEPRLGQLAVASVILQRAEVPGRWGDDVCSVLQPVAFSFLRKDRSFKRISEEEAWVEAVEIATEVLENGPLPELKGADHFHTTTVNPSWSRKMPRVARIGNHIFYADPRSTPAG